MRWTRSTLVLAAVQVAIVGVGAGLVLSRSLASRGFPDVTPRVHGDFRANIQWAGYAARTGTYRDVTASWRVPTISCHGRDSNASFWVGLDGIQSDTVEQVGVETLCRHGQARYSAWYELYPEPSQPIELAVHPGDLVRASVRRSGMDFTLTLTDQATGDRFTRLARVEGATGSSVEVIAEQSGDPYTRLSDFGAVAFGGVAVDGAPLSATKPYALAMLHRDGDLRARPGPLKVGGSSFRVVFLRP